MQARPPGQHRGMVAAPPAAPPARKGVDGRRAGYTRRQRAIIWTAALVAFVAAIPLAASLVLQINQQQAQQSQSARRSSVVGNVTTVPKLQGSGQQLARYLKERVQQMTLDEEIGQMLVGAFYGGSYSNDLQAMVVNDHVGSVILYGGNIQSMAQTEAMDAAIQAHAEIPLFISSDQEGGTVNRLLSITGYRPSAEEIAATNDPNRAYQQGVDDGKILAQLGINLNLAPVVDVQTISDSASVLSTRMFGTTPDKVTAFAGAYLEGMQSQNVIGCVKHWPGLGWSSVDPHDSLPIFSRSKADLNSIDFAPYRALIAKGDVDMVMVTHELVPAYDPTMPSSLSPILIDQVLRGELGYQGVVVTDGLHMGALARWTTAQIAVLAVQAGNDMLLSFTVDEIPGIIAALHQAVTDGQITKARIDQSVQRILALKARYGLIQTPFSN